MGLYQNMPMMVLFILIILDLSCDLNFSPSKFLIPISYASILAGTCTLIGISTNIIISDLSAMKGFSALDMFEPSQLGVPIALSTDFNPCPFFCQLILSMECFFRITTIFSLTCK